MQSACRVLFQDILMKVQITGFCAQVCILSPQISHYTLKSEQSQLLKHFWLRVFHIGHASLTGLGLMRAFCFASLAFSRQMFKLTYPKSFLKWKDSTQNPFSLGETPSSLRPRVPVECCPLAEVTHCIHSLGSDDSILSIFHEYFTLALPICIFPHTFCLDFPMNPILLQSGIKINE